MTDCCLPRLLALWELAGSQPFRNLGKHNGVSELGLSREHEVISFLRIWTMAKSPNRPHSLFPPLFFTFNPKDHRRAAAMVEWKVRLDLWAGALLGARSCHSLKAASLPVVGYGWSFCGQLYFFFLRQNYPSLHLLGLLKIFFWLLTSKKENYIPYFYLFSGLICVLWKSWFKNNLALIYFKGIPLKYNT